MTTARKLSLIAQAIYKSGSLPCSERQKSPRSPSTITIIQFRIAYNGGYPRLNFPTAAVAQLVDVGNMVHVCKGLATFPKLSKSAKSTDVKELITLKDLNEEFSQHRYLYLYRVLRALEEEEVIHPFRGDRNEYLLTLDDARRLRRFLQLREVERGFQIALLRLQIEERDHQIERLKRLLPVEVKLPWWKRIWPWSKTPRSQRQPG